MTTSVPLQAAIRQRGQYIAALPTLRSITQALRGTKRGLAKIYTGRAVGQRSKYFSRLSSASRQ